MAKPDDPKNGLYAPWCLIESNPGKHEAMVVVISHEL
jgi:hypothetical protein